MKYLIAASVLSAIAYADLTINSFLTPVQAGKDQTITWSYDGSPQVGSLTFTLVNGPTDTLQAVSTIATGVDPSADSLTWAVPANIADSSDYALQVTGTSSSGTVYRYTARFVVTGGTGSASSSSSASSSNTETSSSASDSTVASVTKVATVTGTAKTTTSSTTPTVSHGPTTNLTSDSSVNAVGGGIFGSLVFMLVSLL